LAVAADEDDQTDDDRQGDQADCQKDTRQSGLLAEPYLDQRV